MCSFIFEITRISTNSAMSLMPNRNMVLTVHLEGLSAFHDVRLGSLLNSSEGR